MDRPGVVNAMTVDVEDYFHVSVFDGVIPRHRWEQLESRVCANTERLLQLFADHHVTANGAAMLLPLIRNCCELA